MKRFSRNDVREILDKIEKELDAVRKLEKIQKMKMRAKIRQQENWLLGFVNPTPQQTLRKLEGKLSDVLRLYPYGFSDELEALLKRRVRSLEEI